MNLRFAHVMIQVRDLDQAIAFYTRVFDLTVADRHVYDGASLAYLQGARGECEIELLSEMPWRFAPVPEKGRSHIAFTCNDIAAERARIEALGVVCGAVTPYRANGVLHTHFFYIYDLEGNEIEILESAGRYSDKGNRHDTP